MQFGFRKNIHVWCWIYGAGYGIAVVSNATANIGFPYGDSLERENLSLLSGCKCNDCNRLHGNPIWPQMTSIQKIDKGGLVRKNGKRDIKAVRLSDCIMGFM